MRTLYFFTLCLLLAFAKTSFSQSSYTLGVEALQNGQFEKAGTLLSSHLDSTTSAAAYYNLALALREQNDIGMATWAALSADALGGVGESKTLLRALQQQVPVELRPLSRSPLQSAWRGMTTLLDTNVWATLALLACIIGCVLILPRFLQRFSWIAPGIAFSIGLLSFCLGLTQANFMDDQRAVVLKSSGLFVSPAAEADRQKSLPVGTILSLGEQLNAFYAVKIPTGETGWVPSSSVRRVLSKD